jgi:hypothetical protein
LNTEDRKQKTHPLYSWIRIRNLKKRAGMFRKIEDRKQAWGRG